MRNFCNDRDMRMCCCDSAACSDFTFINSNLYLHWK